MNWLCKIFGHVWFFDQWQKGEYNGQNSECRKARCGRCHKEDQQWRYLMTIYNTVGPDDD